MGVGTLARAQTINTGPMATCTGHLTAGEAIKFSENRWVIKEKRVNGNAISENAPPAGGGHWRKKPNENEIGVTSRGREWKSAGKWRKAQKRIRGAPKRSREKELLLFLCSQNKKNGVCK
ncbi:hypothetical protein TNCV_1266691 [Trichonephila clavipes]|nr:hypothetical protein TNCV_1266691 [Trichonephila clavipes]